MSRKMAESTLKAMELYAKGLSITEIGKELGVSKQCISEKLTRYKVHKPYRKVSTPEERSEAVKLVIEKNMTPTEAGAKLGMSQTVVRKSLLDAGYKSKSGRWFKQEVVKEQPVAKTDETISAPIEKPVTEQSEIFGRLLEDEFAQEMISTDGMGKAIEKMELIVYLTLDQVKSA